MLILDIGLYFAVMAIAFAIPGFLLSFFIKDLDLIERLLTAIPLSFVLYTILFVFIVGFNIPYSNYVAYGALAIVYIVSIVVAFKFKNNFNIDSNLSSYLFSVGALIVVLIAFLIRFGSYSAVFAELDPYYYLTGPELMITKGWMPYNDQLAWQPELKMTHRGFEGYAAPILMQYSLYTSLTGEQFSPYLLSLIASIFPALYAAFATFFIYLLFSRLFSKEIAIGLSLFFTFIPMFILKLTAGEFEIQPNSFFTLSAIFAFFFMTIKEYLDNSKIRFDYAIAGSLFLFLSHLSAVSTMIPIFLFMFSLPLLAYYSHISETKFYPLFKIYSIFFLGILLASISRTFVKLQFDYMFSLGFFVSMLVSLAIITLFGTKEKELLILNNENILELSTKFRNNKVLQYIFAAAIIFIFFFTPIANIFLNPLSVSGYTNPLQKTIAEQGAAGSNFIGSLGFFGASEKELPVISLLSPFSILFNIIFSLISSVLSSLFNIQIIYVAKNAHLVTTTLLIFIAIAIYKLYLMFFKKQNNTIWLLFAILIIPVSIIGIVKAKYSIYLAFVIVFALAILFDELKKYIKFSSAILALTLILALAEATLVYPLGSSLLQNVNKMRFQENPVAMQPYFLNLCNSLNAINQYDKDVCDAGANATAYANRGINYQYSSKLCKYSIIDIFNQRTEDAYAASVRCQKLSDYWIDTMDWIRNNTEENATIISWWDYGHWTNYFGLRRTVIRNEHSSEKMIEATAYHFIMGDESSLIKFMKEHYSNYLMLDKEIILAGNSFGGKFGALNYLACSYANQTNLSYNPGQSLCERNNLWETIYVPDNAQQCIVNPELKGVIAYEYSANGLKPTYCLAKANVLGTEVDATYYLDKRDPDGSLKLNKAFLQPVSAPTGYRSYVLLYTKDKIWPGENGLVSGWEDRKGKFYDSIIYRGFFLKDLDNFTLVYETPDGAVKIYKINN